ncbi:glycerophosphodiester phosphodiesterase family protein [Aurantiacibacter zhengii]|uniref:Glycerophosphodiester phosphodiesterase n=1 Tax=Aurantiacibacter zhengii TaxID=2307003 RepID=A0A418NSK4_9SPHN|nr:glycerophosphodiester phosphodiesterase family protein [Aurantiacibacter zhengii]RIV86615.1 glycerophosphodiester phosphodiesterase [Aurantiacibacter zhengii]
MKRWLGRGALLAAIAFLVLTMINASWLAPDPIGGPKLIAHRGVAQIYYASGVGRDTCTATRIEEPVHDYLENTARSMLKAQQIGAQMVEIDIAPTADGEIAVFHDWMLDCRTNGSGEVREATLDELRALDIGYGYTADQGESFPLRGSERQQMPTLAEALEALPRTPIMFNFKSADPAEADLLAAKLRAAGREVEKLGDGFYGHPAPVARMARLFPAAWTWSTESARACSQDYVLYGWTGYLPQSCRGGTMVVPLDDQWMFWGWPNRTLARMQEHGGHIIVTGPREEGTPNQGLLLPEQFTQIPSTYSGHIWAEDIWTLGPALRPSMDRRRPNEQQAAQAGLEQRRQRLAD